MSGGHAQPAGHSTSSDTEAVPRLNVPNRDARRGIARARRGIAPVILGVIVVVVAAVVVVGGLFAAGVFKSSSGGSGGTTATFTVTFAETGLAGGASWAVTLNGVSQSSSTSTIAFSEPNGSYSFAVTAVAGYSVAPASGTVAVTGANVLKAIAFAKVTTYSVTFTESGLASGDFWSVTFNGVPQGGTGSSIVFTGIVNGTGYSFSVSATGYTASPASGSITVSGADVTTPITFTAIPIYTVTFTETGLASGTSWSVTWNGNPESSTGTTIVFSEPNGTYSYTVGSVSGYISSPSSGSVSVAGLAQTVPVTFTEVAPGTFSVTFSETGLPSGTSWSVTLVGSPPSSTSSTITFSEANGTYSYTVGSVSGYTASPSSGSVTVAGAAVSVTITFTSTGGGGSPIQGSFIYQPSQTNYSTSLALSLDVRGASAVAYGILTTANGTTHYKVLVGASFSSSTPIALEGSFHLSADASLPGYYDIISMKVNQSSSVPLPNAEVNLAFNSLGVAAANLTLGLSTDPSTPYAYLAFGTYPTFFSNVSLQGVALNTSVISSILNVNLNGLANLAHRVDPNLPTSFTFGLVVVVNQTISLPNETRLSGQAQVIITSQKVSAFISSISSAEGSPNTSMITAAIDHLNEEFVAVCSVTQDRVTYSFLLAPTSLNRSLLQGIVTIDVEQSWLGVELNPGSNLNLTTSGFVHPFVGVTWNKAPLSASGYNPTTVPALWNVSADEPVELTVPTVGVNLTEATQSTENLYGMGYGDSQYISAISTLANPAIFVMISPSVFANPTAPRGYTSYGIAIASNDNLLSQPSVTLYLNLMGVVYNMTALGLGGCARVTVAGCPVLVIDTVAVASPSGHATPDQLVGAGRTYSNVSGFLAGTSAKNINNELGDIFPLVANSPVDVALYDFGYSTGTVGYNLPAVYIVWGTAPTLNVTHNSSVGLYIPSSNANGLWFLNRYSDALNFTTWNLSARQALQSYVGIVRSWVNSDVANGSVVVPGVLLMMSMFSNSSTKCFPSSSSTKCFLAQASAYTDASPCHNAQVGSCLVGNISLSANSNQYFDPPRLAFVNVTVPTTALTNTVGVHDCVLLSVGGSCTVPTPGSVVRCLSFGCAFTPYHVVTLTTYHCVSSSRACDSSLTYVDAKTTLVPSGPQTIWYSVFWGFGNNVSAVSVLNVALVPAATAGSADALTQSAYSASWHLGLPESEAYINVGEVPAAAVALAAVVLRVD